MALGNKCPNCGKQTFHKSGPVLRCSGRDCGAVGWVSSPDPPGGGSGRKCQRCGGRTVRVVAEVEDVNALHCYACGATFLLAV